MAMGKGTLDATLTVGVFTLLRRLIVGPIILFGLDGWSNSFVVGALVALEIEDYELSVTINC